MLLTVTVCAFLHDVTSKHVIAFLASLAYEEGAQAADLDCRLPCNSWFSSFVFLPHPDLLISNMSSSHVRRNFMLASLSVNNTEWSFRVQMKLLVPESAEQFVSLKEPLTMPLSW